MIARIPIPMAIVVTGPAGSGKSKLAAAISDRAECEQVNVGSVLRDRLATRGVVVNHRRDIGRLYFEHFNQQEYVDVILELLRKPIVVDGVRLAVALIEARRRSIAFFHVMRSGPPDWALAPTEPFAADVVAMKDTADCVIDWQPDIAALQLQAQRVVSQVRMRAYHDTRWLWPTDEREVVPTRG